MTLVSLDAIVQADATLIVGIVFIVTLKQALKQEVTRRDLTFVAVAICLYVLSAITAVLPDWTSSISPVFGQVPSAWALDMTVRIFSTLSLVSFYFGLFFTAGAVLWMMGRSETGEGNKRK